MINSYIKFTKYTITSETKRKLTMLQVFRKNWDKTKYLIISGLIITFLLLVTIVYKSDEKIIKKSESILISYESSDLKTFNKFILRK